MVGAMMSRTPSTLTVSFILTDNFLSPSTVPKSETITLPLSTGVTTMLSRVSGVVSRKRTETGDFL